MEYNLKTTTNRRMIRRFWCFITVLLLLPATNIFGQQTAEKQGAYYTGEYPNLFAEAGYARKMLTLN